MQFPILPSQKVIWKGTYIKYFLRKWYINANLIDENNSLP